MGEAEQPGTAAGAKPGKINPAAMSIADAARALSKIGGRPVMEETLRADLAAGAPANADGTINLVHYAAWLVKQMEAGVGD